MYILAIKVFDDFRVDKEAYWHLNALTGGKHLFSKAETFDFLKEWPGRIGRHVICRLPCNRLIRRVIRLVKGKARFTDAQFHLSDGRLEFPRHALIQAAVETHLDRLIQDIARVRADLARRAAEPGNFAKPVVKRHRRPGQPAHQHNH